ncbi:DUF3566 domain-containing protein [Spongiactinospora rosea]|uniref:DUF3566 domain-containing protein n=1 Tax=Spongiactinospora rosea TaxID=2248750 RepID=A0A366LX54_9ACTN|nr:DUF3566 domain-containing protein [Spongiactinospora rosea]RBQ18113.1 DUF3566 domain-containing protein [Spongiactinospora rosea]
MGSPVGPGGPGGRGGPGSPVKPPSPGSAPGGGRPAGLAASAPTTSQDGSHDTRGSLSEPLLTTTSSRKGGKQSGNARTPRKAHLVLRRVEPWSAMKFSFVVSLVCFVILFVAVAVLYGVLSAVGVFDSIVGTVNQLTNPDGKATNAIDASAWFDPVRILGFTALVGAINVVLITALATLGAVIYNLASDVVGGVEVTFSEAE